MTIYTYDESKQTYVKKKNENDDSDSDSDSEFDKFQKWMFNPTSTSQPQVITQDEETPRGHHQHDPTSGSGQQPPGTTIRDGSAGGIRVVGTGGGNDDHGAS